MNRHTLVGGQVLVNVHSQDQCAGEHCCIHNPSAHHMVDWAQNFRQDRGMMERLCPHGVGHPDPDDPTTDTVHGCDGCCDPREFDQKAVEAADAVSLARLAPCRAYEQSDADLEPVGYDGFGAPIYDHQIADDDLPGMWSKSDYLGGDPDERSYAQRERDAQGTATIVGNSIAIRRLEAYDDSWLAGLSRGFLDLAYEGDEAAGEERDVLVAWGDPKPIRLIVRNVPVEVIEIMVGAALIPLCQRELPTEGTE